MTLRREIDTGSRQVTGQHRLVLTSGKLVEEVVVEKLTPGVAVAVDEASLTISFEPGSSLVFAPTGGGRPLPPLSDGFAEPPQDPFPAEHSGTWRRPAPRPPSEEPFGGNYWLAAQPDGALVRLGGRLFQAVEESLQAHLLIDAESLEEQVERRTTLGGRTL
ncbi:MAG: hypothetical protein HY744_04185 [Deltaproteobacteria bacterium]|nr:hypothetical protein [Deltaproteobacteria bacterium]